MAIILGIIFFIIILVVIAIPGVMVAMLFAAKFLRFTARKTDPSASE